MSLISVWRIPAVTLGFSSKRTKSAPPFFLYAFFQSSFACIYCHRRKNVLNMGEGAGLRILGPRVGKGGKLNLAGNRLAGWKPFKHPPPPPRTPPLGRYKKMNSVNPCLADTITYLPESVTYAWGMRLITLISEPRLSEPVALSQNSLKCPNQKFSLIKPKFRTFILHIYICRIALLYFGNVFFAEVISKWELNCVLIGRDRNRL